MCESNYSNHGVCVWQQCINYDVGASFGTFFQVINW